MPLTLVFATDLLSHARDQHVNKQQGGEGHITPKKNGMSRTPFAVKQSTLEKPLPSKKRILPKLKTTHQLPLFCVTPTCTDESNTRRGFSTRRTWPTMRLPKRWSVMRLSAFEQTRSGTSSQRIEVQVFLERQHLVLRDVGGYDSQPDPSLGCIPSRP